MKLYLMILTCLVLITFTAQSAKVKSLIVAEYKEETLKKNGYAYLVSYNFLDGKLISNDTIYGPTTFKENGNVPHVRFDLGKNFIVYNNDKETLKNRIIQIRSNYNPQAVIKEFADTYPHLYHGNLGEFQKFIDLIKRGVIHADSHRSYDCFNQQIDSYFT